MNLLNFIDLEIEKAPRTKSGSSHDKDSVCRTALAAFIGSADFDLRHAVFSDFLFNFGKFLAEKYEKRYSATTNREILRTLRKWIRMAIFQGYVPNIDTMPAVIAKLDQQFWPDAESATKPRQQAALRQDLKVKESVSAMMRNIDACAIRERMGKSPKATTREERTRAFQAQCGAIYLFCLMNYGMEIEEALSTKCKWIGTEEPDKVNIEKYGVSLPMSQSAKNLVKFFNKRAARTEHLFYMLDSKKYKDDFNLATRQIESHLLKYMLGARYPLFKKKSIFIDWLNYAIESGLPDTEAEMLWKCHLGLEPITSGLKAIEKAQNRFSTTRTNLEENWYLLSIFQPSIKRDGFIKRLLASGILGDEEDAKRRIYAPEEKSIDKEHGEYSVLSRYVFFHATPLQAEFANVFSPSAYVLKDRGKMKFAQIPKREIEHLREMLRDFPDVVEMKDGQEWLEEHNAEIMVGCKAIIRSGSLAGREATVVHVKGKKKHELTFFLEFVEGVFKFQTSLEGIELDIIQAP